MSLVAKIRFSSPLPQLDKEFDYLVPDEMLQQIGFGQTVKVPFGSGAKIKEGIVCSVSDDSNPREKLLAIKEISSLHPVITFQQLELCSAVARRQAGTVGELLSQAVPKRYKRVEAQYDRDGLPDAVPSRFSAKSTLIEHLESHNRIYFQPVLCDGGSVSPAWAVEFAKACASKLLMGESSLVVLPDFAELAKFERALTELDVLQHSIRHTSLDTGSKRFLNHLNSLSKIGINYGLRGASFAPALNLALILLWDDGDDSHIEQSSPYWNSREVLLQRAETENCKIVLSSHSPSTEVIRLIELGYLGKVQEPQVYPKVVLTDLVDRLDSQTFVLISNALKSQKPVLVQIANAGWASALACVSCKELRTCPQCSSSLWVDPSGKLRCRVCKSEITVASCPCGQSSTRPTKLGASAFTKQMERSFPDATVVHSNGENRITQLIGESVLVVATPGAEPEVDGGFECIVIADASQMVGAPRLRALEHSLAKWANAISLLRPNGTLIFVGLRGSLAQNMQNLDFYAAVEDDYRDRKDLGLPPNTRLASVSSSNADDHERLIVALEHELQEGKTRKLGVTQTNLLVLDYGYSFGAELASTLSKVTKSLTATSKSKKAGERVYRINMDDSKVI